MRLSFDSAGSGSQPLIFVHGWCCNRTHMAGLFHHFATTHRVIAVDLPGHGDTALAGVPPTFDAFSTVLADFIAAENLSKAVLIGHSMGGVLSVVTSGRCPERVAGVVNLDGALPLTTAGLAGYNNLFNEIGVRGFRDVVAPFLRRSFFLPSEMGETTERLIADMLSAPEDFAAKLLSQFPLLDGEKILHATGRIPLLYVGSSHPRFDEAEVWRIRSDAWIARAAVSGHFLQIFALPQIVAMITRFLEG
jgi:pimeloyl-ACP methyl ester carboxylesterase